MNWLSHFWGLLTGSAHREERIELLKQMRDDDRACGRTEGADRLNSLLRKHDRRKANGRVNGTVHRP